MNHSKPATHVYSNRTSFRRSLTDVKSSSSMSMSSTSIAAWILPFCLRNTRTIRSRSNDGNKRMSDLIYWINYILLRQNTISTAAFETVDGCSVLRSIWSSISSLIVRRWTDEFCVNIKHVMWKKTNRRGCDGRDLRVGVFRLIAQLSVCDTSLWQRLLTHRCSLTRAHTQCDDDKYE